GEWEPVITRVAAELAARAAARPQPHGPRLDSGPLYAEAVRARAERRPAEAEAMARRILDSQPDHVASLRLLGVLRDERRDHVAAADLFAGVAELAPDEAEAHYNPGPALMALARPAEAATHYRRAIALAPDHAKAHGNLGSALRSLGRLAESEDACRRALALAPDSATACNNLGTALADQGRLAEASDSFPRAEAIKPDFA